MHACAEHVAPIGIIGITYMLSACYTLVAVAVPVVVVVPLNMA